MHLTYHDILRHVPKPPLWWLDGVPRYEPFSPGVAAYLEVALVRTECQDCGTRYDVAARSRPPMYHSLRNLLAYTNTLGIGDPPFACRELGAANCCAGYCMGSMEIEILEFWYKKNVQAEWEREPTLERLLADANWNEAEYRLPDTAFSRIYNSDKKEKWQRAREQGDYLALVHLLEEVGCERPAEVANMVDLDRREELFRREARGLTAERSSRSE